MPGLLGSRSFQGGTTPLTVYGPKGIKQFIEVALSVSTTHVKYPLEVVEITEEGTVFEDNEFYVETKRLSHGIECFGYRIVEKDIQGALLVDKLLEMGVKPGPIFKRLKDGEVVELEDGTILNGNEFIGPPQKGRIITILGDTRYCEASRSLRKMQMYLSMKRLSQQKMSNKRMIIFILHLSKLRALHFRQMRSD